MTMEAFFKENPKVALAFSGGVDSAFLLYEAIRCGAQVKAYYVKTAFQPEFEFQDALRLADQLHADMKVIRADVLCQDAVTANPSDRCYHCKKVIFGNICRSAREDGFTLLMDGTNFSDDPGDRPGMRALRELQVRSPLRECELTKAEIRKRSKAAGLFTWNKPAYACLATRIPTGQKITAENLARTEAAEGYLFSLGFRNFRVRTLGEAAKLQVTEDEFDKLMRLRKEITAELKKTYSSVLLDLEGRS